MAKKTTEVKEETKQEAKVAASELAQALVQAINATKGPEKKTAITRKPGNPWMPKDGSSKLKLKRKVYQHSLMVDPDMSTNEEIELMNQLRPGLFCDGHVKVVRRRDKGIDIDYPIKTASQRLKLVNQFGIRNFKELLERCIDESKNPQTFHTEDDD
jgi:hypothetical protein